MSAQRGVYASIFRSTSIYAAGILIHRAVSILLLPLYTRFLTPAEYGVLELVDVTMSMFALVVGARVATGVAYFCGQALTGTEKSRVFSTNIIGSSLASILAICAGWFAAPHLGRLILGTPDSTEIFRIAVFGLALSFPGESLLGRLRVEERPVAFSVLNLVRLVANVGLNVALLVFFGFGLKAILWSNVICGLLVSAYGLASTLRTHGLDFSPKLFLSMLRFSVPVGVVGLSLMVFHIADRLFLQHYSTLAEIGLYSLGYKLGMMISYVQMAFNQHWSAKSYEFLRGQDGVSIFSRTFTYYLAVMMAVSVASWVFAEPALQLLAAPSFRPCLVFVPWIIAAYLVRAAADYVRSVIYISRRPDLDAWASAITALFCLAAYATLIPRFGALGAAWATGLTSLVMLGLSLLLARRVFPARFESSRAAILLGGGGVILVLHALVKPVGFLSQLAAASVATALYCGAILWRGVLNPEERHALAQAVRGFLSPGANNVAA